MAATKPGRTSGDRELEIRHLFAERINYYMDGRKARARRHITDDEFAKEFGVSQSAINAWKTASRLPSLATAEELKIALGLDCIDDLYEPMDEHEKALWETTKAVVASLKDKPQKERKRRWPASQTDAGEN